MTFEAMSSSNSLCDIYSHFRRQAQQISVSVACKLYQRAQQLPIATNSTSGVSSNQHTTISSHTLLGNELLLQQSQHSNTLHSSLHGDTTTCVPTHQPLSLQKHIENWFLITQFSECMNYLTQHYLSTNRYRLCMGG